MHTDERSHSGAPGDFMTVRHLILRGTNAEIGRAVAEIAQRRHGASLEDLRADPVFVRARRDFRWNLPIEDPARSPVCRPSASPRTTPPTNCSGVTRSRC